ncbi:MAG: folate-binding protein YgfZ [Rhodobiaceae bacterium]|nr:folate-binding protein YgfZ [Rhodobiaceae bacterium]MCC0049452.1 folate-binding protein YgfZ [Rhodobiaceae bacterium]
MSVSQPIRLSGRSVFRVSGPDARTLLQGLLTCDFDDIAPGRPQHGALLTPQGKILFEALVHEPAPGIYLFDTDAALAAEFIKRLMFYRLRAKVTIEPADELSIIAVPGGSMDGLPDDPRLPALGARGILPVSDAEKFPAGDASYHAHRIACGIAELGCDYPSGEIFPHEANHDQLGGVDFQKGCFVGQEVVSRMQHRGTARKRFVPAAIDGQAPAMGTEVMAGEKPAGAMGSSEGQSGLALLRLDRLEQAVADGAPLICGEATLVARKPDWAQFDVPAATLKA